MAKSALYRNASLNCFMSNVPDVEDDAIKGKKIPVNGTTAGDSYSYDGLLFNGVSSGTYTADLLISNSITVTNNEDGISPDITVLNSSKVDKYK